MWGFGGRFYWGKRKEEERRRGIVVVFAWMSSEEKNLKKHVDLYSSLGWDSLVCHSQFLNMFFPDKATALALNLLNELIKELKRRPCPLVFASFSGGPLTCMYKALQIIDSKHDTHGNLDEYEVVRNCISGHIYDSCPIDFVSDLATRFVLHPSVLKVSHPPIIVKWIANGFSSSLDTLFPKRWNSLRADYWQTLYSTIGFGAPYLILCSENDDIAPYQTIANFAQRLQNLGGDVQLLKWSSSAHVGHYKHHPKEYKDAVAELLAKAVSIYSQKNEQGGGPSNGSTSSEPQHHLREAVSSSNQYHSLHRVALDLNGQFVVPAGLVAEYHEGRDLSSINDAPEERFITRSDLSTINAHGISSKIMFDECVPKYVEDWDLRLSSSFSSSSKHSHFNPIKCTQRSRL
ncbi:uncharacterized protein LOC111920956 isoform X1 [Lactuca sativa]|uniref:DUF829 domain-containing protein n=1 Tax=Lactuca sativa TaxID=4236 RepID=A0A9R1UWA8_LACSA|nr:uncharacterized protein LOC111920956 isoform X1 [Lactuca sativa]KAJ0194018.1 hypothetical protein LSAT_V11C800388950 [Lactuca sativa]